MKILYGILVWIFAIGMIACTGERNPSVEVGKTALEVQAVEGAMGPSILFDTTVINIGNVVAGEQVICYYKYHNNGDEPLLIQSIKAGCGCTVPEWDREPLQPDDSGIIKVMFDSFSKRGTQNIRITVNTNARNAISSLILKAEVYENQ